MFSYSFSISRGVAEYTPDIFYQIIDSPEVGKICVEIEDARESMLRGEMCREDFESFKTVHKKRLPVFCFHATFPYGRRVNGDAVLSGLCIVDLDHVSGSGMSEGLGRTLVDHALARRPLADEAALESMRALGIVLVHASPRASGG